VRRSNGDNDVTDNCKEVFLDLTDIQLAQKYNTLLTEAERDFF
jgi:hypothetical protein